MSGPKVVRIVTREELEAICIGHIAAVEDAANELKRCAKRYEVSNDALTSDMDGRVDQLRRLFEQERWADIQKQAPLIVTFLKAEGEKIRAKAIAAAEAARSKRRRLIDSARTIIAALEARGQNPTAPLREVAIRAESAHEGELSELEAIISQGYTTLTKTSDASGTTKAQAELARRLGSGEKGQALQEWLASQGGTGSTLDIRLDELMAEIEVLEDPHIVQSFKARAAAVSAEPSTQRRALLTDSLTIELAQLSHQRRQAQTAADKLRVLRGCLRAFESAEARAMDQDISSALTNGSRDQSEALAVRAGQLINAEMSKLAASARRRAVLGALSKLGYEVREDMSTVWARDGRLVLQKPNVQDYGVELGSARDVARLQIRLVGAERPATHRDTRRDRDMETIWCTEFSQLQQMLATSGTEMTVERAIEAGVQPVKSIAMPELEREQRRTQQPRQRQQ